MTRRPDPRTRAAVAAAAAALLATLTACNATGEAAAPPSSAPTTAPSAMSPTAPLASSAATPTATTPPTPKEQAVAQAEQAVRDYFRVTDQLASKPNRVDEPLTLLRTVATGTGLNDARDVVVMYKDKHWRLIGRTEIASIRATSVDLTFMPKKQPPKIPGVRLDACYDVSKANVVDKEGKSVIEPGHQARTLGRFWVSNYSWPDANGWKVSATDFSEEKPCSDAS